MPRRADQQGLAVGTECEHAIDRSVAPTARAPSLSCTYEVEVIEDGGLVAALSLKGAEHVHRDPLKDVCARDQR